MNKNLLVTALLIIVGITATSQKKAYISFNTGIAFPAVKDVIGLSSNTVAGGNFTNTNIYGSFGGGIPVTIRGGYKLNNKVALELGASYLFGTNVTTDKTTTPNLDSYTKVKGYQTRVLPSIVFKGENEALHLYSKVGFVLPIGGQSKFTEYTKSSGTETMLKGETTNSFSLGYNGSLGVSIKIAEDLMLFSEVEFISLRMKRKTKILTEFKINDSDQLQTLSIQQKETLYVDEITSDDNTKIDEPLKLNAETINYSTFGFNLGIKYLF